MGSDDGVCAEWPAPPHAATIQNHFGQNKAKNTILGQNGRLVELSDLEKQTLIAKVQEQGFV